MNRLGKWIDFRGVTSLAHDLGVSVPTVSNWKAGRKMPGPQAAAKIAEMSGMDLAEINPYIRWSDRPIVTRNRHD